MSKLRKIEYLMEQTQKRLFGVDTGCPNCGNKAYLSLDTKYFVSELRECVGCGLMFRFPLDRPDHGLEFYQSNYKQGFTTSLPTDEELRGLITSQFSGHEKSYAHVIQLMQLLGIAPPAKVFDFGCSWGYGSWQFLNSGFEVSSYEISLPRAEFARAKLGLSVSSDMATLTTDETMFGQFDVFFSNHVIEHVPRPQDAVDLALCHKLINCESRDSIWRRILIHWRQEDF